MNNPVDDNPTSVSPPREDEEIYCVFCHYNLTGNLTGRCSECGSMFDRELLLQAARDAAQYVIPWDRPEKMPLLRRFWGTLRLTWFRPREFALAFGFVRRKSRAGSFVIVCASMLVLVVLVTVGADWWLETDHSRRRSSALYTITFRDAGVWIGSSLSLVGYVWFVTLLGSLLLTSTVRHRDGSKRFWPWWTICRYAAGHFVLLLPLPLVVVVLAAAGDFDVSLVGGLVGSLMLFGCVFLWGLTMRHVVRERAARSHDGIVGVTMLLATVAIAPAAVAAILLGRFVAGLLWLWF